MKSKDKIISFLISIIVLVLYIVVYSYSKINTNIDKVYNVYLDGKIIGVIASKDELYELINQKQQDIKEKYNVKNVYPPETLKVLENYSYSSKVDEVYSIYEKIELLEDFSVMGYEFKIAKSDKHDEYSIYVLDKDVFYDGLKKFVLSFVSEDDLNNYMNGTQKEIDDVGIIYKDMKINENIVLKEKYISTNAKIYQNSDELAKDLLFGFNNQDKSYTVKSGDTIESISESHTLNVQEFLIANPKFTSKDNILAIGDTVNVTLINPEISFTYMVNEVKEQEVNYDTKIERDNTKPSSYSEITTPGVNGLYLQYSNYSVTNGEMSSNVDIYDSVVIREKVDQVTTKGKKSSGIFGRQKWTDTGSGWHWPTKSPYMITSEFAYRWGSFHNGMDISGTGEGSNIFAANDGVVVYVNKSCPNDGGSSLKNTCGGGYGNYLIIDHGDNIYTLYAHCWNDIPVSVGTKVSRGQVVAHMGNSGRTSGYHLHFGFSIGYPGKGTFRNPRELFK
jgi:murein DD-endopeptidase MepM/ murein hydrolase activator NlpD